MLSFARLISESVNTAEQSLISPFWHILEKANQ